MFCLPKVSKADFPVLKSAMNDSFPQSYGQWVDLLTDLCFERGTKDVAVVDVNTETFISYMGDAGRKLDLQDLLDFAAFNPWHDPDDLAASKPAPL